MKSPTSPRPSKKTPGGKHVPKPTDPTPAPTRPLPEGTPSKPNPPRR